MISSCPSPEGMHPLNTVYNTPYIIYANDWTESFSAFSTSIRHNRRCLRGQFPAWSARVTSKQKSDDFI